MSDSNIEWTDKVWNVLRGCSRVSAGCENCYAEAVAARFSGPGLAYEGLARRRSNGQPQWTGVVRFVESKLLEPMKWHEPKRVFVNSMSDLFHEKVSDETIDLIFAVMALTPRHTYQCLTKRPARMLAYMNERFQKRTDIDAGPVDRHGKVLEAVDSIAYGKEIDRFQGDEWWTPEEGLVAFTQPWPLPNVHLGVSVEDQRAANERIPLLLDTPAAIRFLSCEPLLGPVQIAEYMPNKLWNNLPSWKSPELSWIIVGGESGRGAREFDLGWARDLVAQCANAQVACFVKQLGANPIDPWADTGALANDREPARPEFRHSHGGDMAEWPVELRVREFPAAVTP